MCFYVKIKLYVSFYVDTFEDLWPASERPSTYVQQLLEWRPTGLYPIFPSKTDPQDDRSLASSDDDDEYDLDTLLRGEADFKIFVLSKFTVCGHGVFAVILVIGIYSIHTAAMMNKIVT